MKLICWPSWAISEYYCAFFGYSDTLPHGLLCLLGYSASRTCLLGYFASWATLLLGLASWACLLVYFASWATLPLGPRLIDIVCFDNAETLICLLGCAITGHLLVCKMISYVNMRN
jgi:hypothetical protein